MDSSLLIQLPITDELAEFRKMFEEALSSDDPLLKEVTAYIRRRSGKMMRPMLVMLVARLFGRVSDVTLHTAVSLELLHTASLVHDDVVDESDKRRGQLSVNAAFNNKIAVLAGDYLLATSLVHSALTQNPAIVSVVAELGQELAQGELLQLSNVHSEFFSEEVYFDVIRKKTAALFSACTKAAAISAGASAENIEAARLFGEHIGICFQIKDDIFDYSDNSEIGKPTGNDMAEGKLTLPLLHVLNTTQETWPAQLALKVRCGEASAPEIARLVEFAKANGGIGYAEQVMYSYRDKALGWIGSLHTEPELVNALTAFVNYVADRTK